MNPVDLDTRGLTITQILVSSLLHGSTWIKNETEWPKKLNVKNVEVGKVYEEFRYKVTVIESLANWHKFSNFKRLQNTIARVLRKKRK